MVTLSEPNEAIDLTKEFSEGVFVATTATISSDARIYGSVRGNTVTIGDCSTVYDFVVIKCVGGTGNIEIGSHCHINPHSVIYSGSGVRIGNYVLIGPSCVLAPANHAYATRNEPIREQGFMPSKGGINIADDVWIGANCTLLDGANIGKGAIVAAGSVVTGTLAAYGVYAGIPAKKIKERHVD